MSQKEDSRGSYEILEKIQRMSQICQPEITNTMGVWKELVRLETEKKKDKKKERITRLQRQCNQQALELKRMYILLKERLASALVREIEIIEPRLDHDYEELFKQHELM